jgi:predicted RNase H-like HicB family nuclease
MLPTLQLPVVIERDEDGYYAYCPSLQGCQTQGRTYEQALENIRDAVQLYLEDMKENGEELPTVASCSLTTVTVAV